MSAIVESRQRRFETSMAPLHPSPVSGIRRLDGTNPCGHAAGL